MYFEDEENLRQKVRSFAEENLSPIAGDVDRQNSTSKEVVNLLAEEDIFRYLFPKKYGGKGLDPLQLCIIREELARVCIQASDSFIMSEMAGYPILRFGTENQKEKYLPSLANGEKIGSYALTEPGGGSDVANIKTTAKLEDKHYLINGKKSFTTNAGKSEVCVLFAKTAPDKGAKGISAFIVDPKNEREGLNCKTMDLMGPCAEYELEFEGYRVPKEDLLGKEGKGMKIALTALDVCRSTVGAHSVGIAQAAFEEALDYAGEREAFGKTLNEFQATQFKLADMKTQIEAARLLVMRAASETEIGKEEEIIEKASMAKLFSTEMAQKVVDEALQIHGGKGLFSGSRMELLYKAVRLPRIYEGTSEIQKLTIARSILS